MSLTNRPLVYTIARSESEGIPSNIPRGRTYDSIDSFYLDYLALHDSILRHQPNSVKSNSDAEGQLASRVAMRALLPNFVSRLNSGGPFVFSLTDLHQNNIFVDKEWNVTCLIDL